MIIEYQNYFEQIARDYKPIGHTDNNKRFAALSFEDVLTGQRDKYNINNLMMFLLPLDTDLKASDTSRFKYVGSFQVVKKSNSPTQTKAILAETESAAKEIVAVLLKRHSGRFGLQRFTLGELDTERIKFIQLVETDGNTGLVGCEVRFNFSEGWNWINAPVADNWNISV